MSQSEVYFKHKIIDIEGETKAPLDSIKSNYIDFYLYVDSQGDVYKMVCYDFAAKYTIIKGVERLGHRLIDKENHCVNIVVVHDSIYRCGRTHFNTVIEAIRGLYNDFRRNTNMDDKVSQMGLKYGFSTEYKIKNKI